MLRQEMMPSGPLAVLLAFPNPDCRKMLHSVIRPSGSVMLTWSLTRLHSKGARTLCSKLRPRYPEKLARWELKQQKAKEKRKATWVLNANVFQHTYTHSQKCHAKCLMFGKRKQWCKSPRTGAKTMWWDGNNLSNICFDNDSNIPQQHRPIRCLCWIWVLVSIRHSVNLAGYGDEF